MDFIHRLVSQEQKWKQNRFPKRCAVVSCMFLVCVLLCVVCVFPRFVCSVLVIWSLGVL
jgi:hypothetical protein